MSTKKKTQAVKNSAGKKAVRTGRKSGESQQDFLRIPDPPKPPVKTR